MKNFKKIVIAAVLSCLLLIPTVSTVSAADMFSKENILATFQLFGIDLSDPESVQKVIEQVRDGGLSGFLDLFNIDVSEALDELQDYLSAMTPTTQPEETTTEEEPTTEPEETTTEEPTTAKPKPKPQPTYPSYNYTPPTYTPATTLPPETTTFQFIPPEQIYTEAFTTTVFKPVVEDDVSSIDDTNPIKTVIGVILLLGSGIGVIVVVLALKRNRI